MAPEPPPSLPLSLPLLLADRACWLLYHPSWLLQLLRLRWSGAAVGSGSRISALNPLPNAFLGISDNLLGKLDVALCTFTMYVVEHYRHAMAWRFSQANVSRNYGFEDLRTEEAAKISGNLL